VVEELEEGVHSTTKTIKSLAQALSFGHFTLQYFNYQTAS
jgi:hypothetical protein